MKTDERQKAWVRDIELRLAQHEALRQRNPIYNQQLAGRSVAAAKRRAERVRYPEHVASSFTAPASSRASSERFRNTQGSPGPTGSA